MQNETEILQADIRELKSEIQVLQIKSKYMITKTDLAEFRATTSIRWTLAVFVVYLIAFGLILKYI